MLCFYHDWRNALKLQKMSKNSSKKGTGQTYGQKLVCSDNSEQDTWYRVKECSKIEQDFKNKFNFVFFDGYCQRLISGRRTERCAASPTTFGIFLIFPVLLTPVVPQLVTQLVHQVCYGRYQVSFYLWWFRPELNY